MRDSRIRQKGESGRSDKRFVNFGDLLTAAALAVFGGLVLPLQTFVPNASNYDYSTLALLPELSLCTILLFVSTFVLLAMSDRYLRGYLTPVLAVVVVFAYLNAGMLSLDVPEINGELPLELQSVGRKVWDTALFAVALLAAVSTFRWTRTWLHWIPAGILVLGLASLADLRADERDVDEVTTILSADRRLYREYDRHEDECQDWVYCRDGNLTKDSPER